MLLRPNSGVSERIMALELEYRNTFIDVKEEFQDEVLASRQRAHSSPPGPLRRSSFTREMNADEAAMQSYVGGLAQSATQIGPVSSTFAEDPFPRSATEFTPVEREQMIVPSEGSWGHPDVCRRPCIHFISGNCETGKACAYCHLPHTEKMAKLDKRQRAMVQQLTHRELVSMVLPLCFRKAEEGGFAEKAGELLGLLEVDRATSSTQPIPGRDLRNLSKAISRLSFSSLIGLVARKSPDQDEDSSLYAASLMAALETLRSQEVAKVIKIEFIVLPLSPQSCQGQLREDRAAAARFAAVLASLGLAERAEADTILTGLLLSKFASFPLHGSWEGGRCVFGLMSKLNHACFPNCVCLWPGLPPGEVHDIRVLPTMRETAAAIVPQQHSTFLQPLKASRAALRQVTVHVW
ncbi:hypothetical protein AK812_SmicGene4108 [Symbiodinium microadriaticum]|uniref:C3H1-type domain-containing protein n=1 Tax=Symbiodinium microadriaticum TaxID=2951 RepID=A0A1Q9EX94_SYMMI|nr:hypothetical protein AK812_SmicGene4108 [Symbiodinium microadriaticum]